MKEVQINISFFQYGLNGAAPKDEVCNLDSVSFVFNDMCEQLTNGCEKSALANLIALFCDDSSTEHLDPVVQGLVGAYLLKHPDQLDSDEINLSLEDLCIDYGMNVEQVIEHFNIFVLRHNQVLECNANDLGSLPKHLQDALNNAKELGLKEGMMILNPMTGEVEIITEKEHDKLYGKGTFEKMNQLGKGLVESHIAAKEHKALPEHKTLQ